MRSLAAVALGLLMALAGGCNRVANDGAPATPPTEEPDAAEEADDDEAEEGEPEPDDEEGPVEVTTTVVATGLQAPWDVAFTDDGRTFITERDLGVLSELDADGQLQEIATFPINNDKEGGLLGLTASPDFAEDETLYVYYTSAEDNRIVRLVVGEEAEPVLTGIPKSAHHNGGRIAFGPDDALYATTGDTVEGALAQDPESLGGKVLRMTADGEVPDDNPSEDSLVYALGLRNVQGLAWDTDGQLYITEFGPANDDAIYRVEAGANYGWPAITASQDTEEYAEPIAVRQPPEASWSGAGFLIDGAIPQWEGDLFAAGLRGERLWRFELTDDGEVAESEDLLVEEYGRLRHVTQAPDGSLWVLTSNRDGRGHAGPDDDRILRLGPAEEGGGTTDEVIPRAGLPRPVGNPPRDVQR